MYSKISIIFVVVSVLSLTACDRSSTSSPPDEQSDTELVVQSDDVISCSEISLRFENLDAEGVTTDTEDQTFATPTIWENPIGKFSSTPYGQGGYPAITDGAGERLFTGGNVEQSIGAQTVAVAIGDIGCPVRLTADIGGFSTQDDNAVVDLSFLSSNNEVIETLSLGPVTKEERENKTILLPRSVNGVIPELTVQARLTITHERLQGSANDGYVDNIDLSVR